MYSRNFQPVLWTCFFTLLLCVSGYAQVNRGTISGHATDSVGAVLQGATVELQPRGAPTTTDVQGNFTISNLSPGEYTLTVSSVGFAQFTTKVTVNVGFVVHVDAALKVATESEEIMVHAEREHGEAEAVNRERTADNILNVLPAEVITSLPNANVADAIGRLPSVTLERDEGEGKYVQIRGTEPRLSNLTIDGINVPSPESGVRQVKLDTIPADLVCRDQQNTPGKSGRRRNWWVSKFKNEDRRRFTHAGSDFDWWIHPDHWRTLCGSNRCNHRKALWR